MTKLLILDLDKVEGAKEALNYRSDINPNEHEACKKVISDIIASGKEVTEEMIEEVLQKCPITQSADYRGGAWGNARMETTKALFSMMRGEK
jgi:hypothetical protein